MDQAGLVWGVVLMSEGQYLTPSQLLRPFSVRRDREMFAFSRNFTKIRNPESLLERIQDDLLDQGFVDAEICNNRLLAKRGWTGGRFIPIASDFYAASMFVAVIRGQNLRVSLHFGRVIALLLVMSMTWTLLVIWWYPIHVRFFIGMALFGILLGITLGVGLSRAFSRISMHVSA